MSPIQPGYLLPRRETLLAFTAVMLGMLLAALNQTIIATALPTIVSDLGGMDHYTWVFAAYMLGLTVTVPVYGRLSDIYGRRPFFAFGIVTFMVGAVVGATADSMTQLIVARGIQGIGGGALIPLAVAVIGDLIPPARRGRWQGFTGAVFGLASVLGPMSGGWIVDHAHWQWVFLVSLPIAVVALVMGVTTLKIPVHPEAGTRVDYVGAALLMAGLSCGLLATIWGGSTYPWGSTEIAGLYAASAVLLSAFAWQERRTEQPLLPLDLFSDRTFTAANLAAFAVGAGMFGSIMFVPLFVQGVIGASATSSGAILTPLMLGLIVTSVASGQVITRTGRYRWALLGGPAIMGVGFVLLSQLGVDSTQGDATIATIVLGLGIGLLLQNLVLVVQNSVPSRTLGVATSASQFFRTTGGTIGVAVMGAILSSHLGAAAASAGTPGAGIGGSDASREALASAIHPIFLLGIPLMAITLILASRIPEVPLRRGVREEANEPGTTLEQELAPS